jgi:hypothetical protein
MKAGLMIAIKGMKNSHLTTSMIVLITAILAFCIGYFLALPSAIAGVEGSTEPLTVDGHSIDAVKPDPIQLESSIERKPAHTERGRSLELGTAQAQIERLEMEILALKSSCASLEQEVLISDTRVSRLEREVENAFLDPSSSPFGSFLGSSVGLHANALERLMVLRVLQDIPVVLSEAESVWLLEDLRKGENLDVNYQSFISLLGSGRVQNELSSKEFRELRAHLSGDSWRLFYPGWAEDVSTGERL